MAVLGFLAFLALLAYSSANEEPVFIHNMDGLSISDEAEPGSVVYQLVGTDSESEVYYGVEGADDLLSVDRRTGVVTLLRQLSSTVTPVIHVTVTLEDLEVDGPANKVSEKVQLSVVNAEPKPEPENGQNTVTERPPGAEPGSPVFSAPDVQLEVTENWPVGVALPVEPPLYVAALGQTDTKIDLTVWSPTDFVGDLFEIEPQSLDRGGEFEILLQKSLVEFNEQLLELPLPLTLYVQATDGTNGASNTLPVYVTILDINDHRPTFEKPQYSYEITSTITEAYHIDTIKAVDADRGQFGTGGLVFHLFGPFAKHFGLSTPAPGFVDLTLRPCKGANCVWSELPERFTLVLRAADTNGTGLYTDVQLEFEVEKENIYGPMFTASHYMALLREQSTEFESLLQVNAVDQDGSPVTYSLDDSTNLFGVDASTGILFVEHPDFVTVANLGTRFNITAIASDGHNVPARVNIVLEILEQTEAKNRPPTFETKDYELNALVGQEQLGFVSAVDPEGPVEYHLAEGGAGYFLIDQQTGELSYKGPLLKETQTFDLEVIAVDSGRPPMVDSANVVVNVQGLGSVPPKFLQTAASVTIMQNALPGDLLHEFVASDPDSQGTLLYGVSAVSAFDRLGTLVDDPNGQLPTYFVFGAMGKNNGSLYLTHSFDSGLIMSVHLTVAVADTTHPSEPEAQTFLVVNIEPVESKAPPSSEFLQFESLPPEISVPQTLPVGSYVYTVKMKTLSSEMQGKVGKILFTLGKGREYFSIDDKTGVIRLVKSLTDSSTEISHVDLSVRATHSDSGESSTADIKILAQPENNNAPRFDQFVYEGSVSEDAQIGTVVLSATATDADGGAVIYSLSGADAQAFTIDEQGQLRTAVAFDRELLSSLDLQLQATDTGGRTSSVPINIQISDANDHSPVFAEAQYSATVMENSPLDSHLLQVRAEDKDSGENAKVTYSLINVEETKLANVLSIDPSDGVVRNSRPLSGLQGLYRLAAVATDGGGRNASVPLFLTVQSTSQCQPTFASPVGNHSLVAINENGPDDLLVTTFVAKTTGTDCVILYVIWNETIENFVDSTQQFRLDPKSGELRAKKSFDREMETRYKLVVAAQSGSLYIETSIEIQILDLNDNVPEFSIGQLTWNIPEDAPQGSVVGKVQATDADSGKFGQIYYHLLSKDNADEIWPISAMFELGATDGRLSLRQQLDREKKSIYQLWILVSNQPENQMTTGEMLRAVDASDQRTDIVQIVVKVDDVNDNGPVFDKREYLVAAPEAAPAGLVLTTVHAQDPDSFTEEHVAVSYRIAKSMYHYKGDSIEVESPLWSVDSSSGQVAVAHDIREFSQGYFVLTINSADLKNVSEAQSDSTQVKIWVYEPEQLVRVQVADKPQHVSDKRVIELTDKLGRATDSLVVLREVEYHTAEGTTTSGESVDLLVIFVNKTSEEVMPVAVVTDLLDKSDETFKDEQIVYVASATAALTQEDKLSVAAIALIAFACVLCVGLLGFLLLVCFYRYAFMQEKKTLDKRPAKPPPAPIKPAALPFRENPLWIEPQTKSMNYDVQELSLSVAASENGTARPRYSSQPSYASIPSYEDQMAMAQFDPETLRAHPYSQVNKAPSRRMSQESGWYETVDK